MSRPPLTLIVTGRWCAIYVNPIYVKHIHE
jgi:hypothetical protein